MKKLFIIANWKSNKTIQETEKWLHDFHEGFKLNNFPLDNKEIILSPSFTLFEHSRYCSNNLNLPIRFGAQNISPFDEGPYTGEVSAKQIKELADYVIIGHSERRKHFFENDEMVNQKIEQALKHDLVPILCISNIDQVQNSPLRSAMQNFAGQAKLKSDNKMLVAYEPLFAIGSGHPDTPKNADSMGKKIKEILGSIPILYGGSVTEDNVKSFTSMPNIDGVLVGGASLDPLEFLKIIKNA